MNYKFFRIIADIRFAVLNLFLISLVSIIGTIIEQDESIEIYKLKYPLINPLFGFLSWDKILLFELDHVYKTWWFLSLILIFAMSLITCTFLQQFPSLKIARRCQFFRKIEQFSSLKIVTKLETFYYTKIIFKIKKLNYSIFQQKYITYTYKGLIGKLSPITVHFSMILILMGTVFGSIYGFKAQEIIPKNEIGHIQNILTTGYFTNIPNNSIRVNDFWVTYNKKQILLQFYSDISILNNKGKELKRQTNYVNSPVIFENVYYYQTDWNLIGLRFSNSYNQVIEYPLIQPLTTKSKIWLTWVSKNLQSNFGLILIINNLQGYCSVYDQTGMFLGNLELNENIQTFSLTNFLEILNVTGLQIKRDSGIPLIYTGSLLLMVSTITSYISYSQIWMIQKKQDLYLGGTTNRALFEFEFEFFKLFK